MTIPDVWTARLRLVAMTPDLLDADEAGAKALEPLLQARVPAEWPDENWEPHVFSFLRKQFAGRPETQAWNRYVVLAGQHPVVIGTVGAFPRNEHEAEIGYAILKPWQRLGFATEAARATMGIVCAQPQIATVIAHTFPHLSESIRVLEKCGLVPDGDGEEPGTIRYRWRNPAAPV